MSFEVIVDFPQKKKKKIASAVTEKCASIAGELPPLKRCQGTLEQGISSP